MTSHAASSKLKVGGVFTVICVDKHGREKWRDTSHNLAVNVGIDSVLNVAFVNQTQIATWFLGLTDASPTIAAGDTMASHAGWTEITAYSEAVRQTWTPAVTTTQVITNATSVDVSINGTATVGGLFVTSNNVKGGTTGTLFAVEAFTGGNQAVANGDTLRLTYTLTGASS